MFFGCCWFRIKKINKTPCKAGVYIFSEANPQYKDHYKIFFFGEEAGKRIKDKKTKKTVLWQLAGFADKIDGIAASVTVNRTDKTVSHELLHVMGLHHSFEDTADYSFEKHETENIMDYASKRNHLWHWQWKQLWANKKLEHQKEDKTENTDETNSNNTQYTNSK